MHRASRTTLLVLLAASTTAILAGCTDGGATSTATTTATATVTARPSATGAASGDRSCGPTSGSAAAERAIAALPIPAGLDGATWDAAGADLSGYDPCAALSWSVVAPVGATPSSPYAVLLFHDGSYLGTATATQYGFSPEIRRTAPDAITVVYRYAQGTDANANPTGRSTATFTWDESADRVVMRGSTPPE